MARAGRSHRVGRAPGARGAAFVTVAEALAFGRERLAALGRDGRFDAARLLEEVVGQGSGWLLAHDDASLETGDERRYLTAIARRERGEPVAYILESAGFFGRVFRVTPDVLVPRPETEMLVDLACALASARPTEMPAPTICDVGTGSGILAITLALEIPRSTVTAVDISSAALAVAATNAAAHGVADRVRCIHADGSRDLPAPEGGRGRYDLIVANLPYVRSRDIAPVPPGLAFEPLVALDGGPDGLEIYARFLRLIPAMLAPLGSLLMEAGPDTTIALAALARQELAAMANFVNVHRDYAGHPRVVEVRFSAAPRSLP